MPWTVRSSFETFRRDIVDLDVDETKRARASRDFLWEQLKKLSAGDSGFPRLSGEYLNFGSFARRTKICPLNDIDMMFILDGRHITYSAQSSYRYRLKLTSSEAPLYAFRDTHGYISSIKILNKIRDSLSNVSQYSKAVIKRSQQAVALNLKSYDWTFDIVPSLAMGGQNAGEIACYFIPDGKGEWICTDPRRDSKAASEVGSKHGSYLLQVMRLLKFWNRRTIKPVLPSYYFETLVLNIFRHASKIDSWAQGVKYFLDNSSTAVLGSCPDPKGMGPNLDADISFSTKQSVVTAILEHSKKAGYAQMYESQGDGESAIYWWGQIFGPSFPAYG